MALTIISGTVQISINRVVFDSGENAFFCYESSNQEPVFKHYLPFVQTELVDGFTEKVYFFKNSFFNPGKLLKLELKDKNADNNFVGYIFTLEDLIKNDEIFDSPSLKQAVFKATEKLLTDSNISISSRHAPYRQDSDYNLTDFYDEDSILVVICDQFVNFASYDFTNYIIPFYKLGFRYSPSSGFYPAELECDYVRIGFTNLQKKLKLKSSINALCNNFFIRELISNAIYVSRDNEVARFHLFYQVIEMLMEKVFKIEVKQKVTNEIDNISGFDTKEFFREVMRDSVILEKVVGDTYSSINYNLRLELADKISRFLNYVQSDDSDKLPSKLYKVRNLLFHGYSKVLENESIAKDIVNHLLKKLNDCFEVFIMELIYSHKS